MNKNQMIATSALLVATAVFGDPDIAEAQTPSDTGWNSAATSQQIKKIAKKEPGCQRRNQHQSKHIANITQQKKMPIPAGIGAETWQKMRFTMGTMYVNCEQPGRDKIKPKWESACWTIIGKTFPTFHVQFTGVTFNEYIWTPSNGQSMNPSKFKVGDDGTRQNCATHDIAKNNEEWMWGNKLHSDRRDARHRFNYTANFIAFDDPAYATGTYLFQPSRDMRLP